MKGNPTGMACLKCDLDELEQGAARCARLHRLRQYLDAEIFSMLLMKSNDFCIKAKRLIRSRAHGAFNQQ